MKYKGLLSALIIYAIGGGGFRNLNATELSTICEQNKLCELKSSYPLITNSTDFIAKSTYSSYSNGIYVEQIIDSFINYGSIMTYYDNNPTTFSFSFNTGNITAFTNYGSISGGIQGQLSKNTHITNYGEMGGVERSTVTIANYGEINLLNSNSKKAHFRNVHLTLQDYAMRISERADKFNSFDGNAEDNSHLVVDNVQSVKFADSESRLILDFDFESGFELGAGYLFDKLVVDTSGKNALSVDLSRLVPRSDIYYITQQDDKFIVNFAPQYSTIGNLYKANVRTMNNFLTISNSMIFPRKYSKSQNLGRKNSKNILSLRASEYERGNPKDLRAKRSNHPPYENNVDSALSLKSYESFAYQNESQNLQTRRIQRKTKRNYSRNLSNSQNLNTDSANRANKSQNQRFSQNLAQNPSDYYFILTPFVNHNLFFESGNYNLSGFDYGFLAAFSARVAESNSLGAHFMMSYGSLSDSHDKDFHISNLNLNLGLNYKLDLIFDMYLKARGDFFYFLNQVKTLTMMEAIKPNNLGFGLSVSYGKDFDFKQGGTLGIEAGLDYKALHSNTITLDSMSETYQKSLYHLLYLDLGISYAKYFGGFGLNANLGIKGNVTANKLAKSQIHLNNFNRSVDMILDNDKILGYANFGLSYVLNARNFDMEFSLAYYGNFGDRVISNGGGFEWRVGW